MQDRLALVPSLHQRMELRTSTRTLRTMQESQMMDARSALQALTVLHRPGTMNVVRRKPWAPAYADTADCCMTCPGEGWPCETRRIIDLALNQGE